jgi:hypothetical protein
MLTLALPSKKKKEKKKKEKTSTPKQFSTVTHTNIS